MFKCLTKLSLTIIQKQRNEQIHEAACRFLANNLSISAIQLDTSSTSHWRTIIEQGLRHRETEVQEAAASALQSLSVLIDCSTDVDR